MTSTNTYYYSGLNFVNGCKDVIVKAYNEASKPGELQEKVFTATRTAVGVVATAQHPYYAIAAGTVTAFIPTVAKNGVSFLDSMISGLWNRMSFNQKMAASATGITLTLMGYDWLSIPASIISAKLATELAIKNSGKEKVATATRKAEEVLKTE